MNLPNALTLIRIVLVPLLVVVLLTSKLDSLPLFGVSKDILGAAVFAVASLTDWLDGYVARRRKQITGFGQWMDPLADKLLTTAAFVSLVQMGLAQPWMVAVILGREFAVTVLRTIVHARGHVLPASPIGKVKMAAQVVAILALILGRGGHQWLYYLGQGALWVATITALVSAVDYWRRFNRLPGAKPGAPNMPAINDQTKPNSARDRISA